MSANSTVESFPSSTLRRSSNDVLLKHVTLLNAQTQKTLSKLTIPKVLVLYTGSHLKEFLQINLGNEYIYCRGYNWYESIM